MKVSNLAKLKSLVQNTVFQSRTGRNVKTRINGLPTISRSAEDFTRLSLQLVVDLCGRNDQYNSYYCQRFHNPLTRCCHLVRPVSTNFLLGDQICSKLPYDVTLSDGSFCKCGYKIGYSISWYSLYFFQKSRSNLKRLEERIYLYLLNPKGVSIGGPIVKNKVIFC
jgi:hypothetical protein